jgi:hypothetical protein
MVNDEKELQKVVLTRLMRLNATIYGVIAGLVAGSAVFVATNWLLLKGGPIGPDGVPVVGPHLWLLSQFFIGYKVTFVGSLIGFAYGFVIGFGIGYFVARMYNWIVDLKQRRSGDKA